MSPNTDRSVLLRKARTRAIARLRAEQDERFQELMDEEVERLGGEPRKVFLPYHPRPTTRKKKGAQ